MAKNASKDKSAAKKPEAAPAAKTVQAEIAPASVRSSAIHIGISDKDRAAIAKGLSALLADTYTL
jgi:starvation-inducible DNA-binding protein